MRNVASGILVAALIGLSAGSATAGRRIVAVPIPQGEGGAVEYEIRNTGSKPFDWFVFQVTYPDPKGKHAMAVMRPRGPEIRRLHTVRFLVHRRVEAGTSVHVVFRDRASGEMEASSPPVVSIVAPDAFHALRTEATTPYVEESGPGEPSERRYGIWRSAGAELIEIR